MTPQKRLVSGENRGWRILTILIMSVILTCSCSNEKKRIYERLRAHSEGIRVVNTHEHQHWPGEFGNYTFRFYHLIAASYLGADLTSTGLANGNDWQLIDSLSPGELWDEYGEALDYARNTSYYNQFIKGFQKLYDFNDEYFTKNNIATLSPLVEQNYSDYRKWFDSAFRKCNFDIMFLDQYWNPFNTEPDSTYFALVFNIGTLISEASRRPGNDTELRSVYLRAKNDGYPIKTLDDYLIYCEHVFEKNLAGNVVCLKNAQAYSRTLYYANVSYEEAVKLYAKPSSLLTAEEKKAIEDYIFHWFIKKAMQHDLPVQIHTGYLAGNGNLLENGHPSKLNNLFLAYPRVRFIIFHGGYPWTGEVTAFGKMFPNVYIDLVWLPQISRQRAVIALDEMFDAVPYNKFFWGGDCSLIEESAGSLEIARDVVAEVLAGRVARKLMTEDLAIEVTDRIFRYNAVDVFQLEKKTGREYK